MGAFELIIDFNVWISIDWDFIIATLSRSCCAAPHLTANLWEPLLTQWGHNKMAEHFSDNILKGISLTENLCICIEFNWNLFMGF